MLEINCSADSFSFLLVLFPPSPSLKSQSMEAAVDSSSWQAAETEVEIDQKTHLQCRHGTLEFQNESAFWWVIKGDE